MALELVHQHRAASVALLERHLGIGLDLAEALLQRMARETTTVRRVPSGLYLYTHGPIGEELAALHGFAQEVLAAIAGDSVDVAQLRAAAGRYGLAIPHQAAAQASTNLSQAKRIVLASFARTYPPQRISMATPLADEKEASLVQFWIGRRKHHRQPAFRARPHSSPPS